MIRHLFVLVVLMALLADAGVAVAQSRIEVAAPMPGMQRDNGNAIGLRLTFEPPLEPGQTATIAIGGETALVLGAAGGAVRAFATRVRMVSTAPVTVRVSRGGREESFSTSATVVIPAALAIDDGKPVAVRAAATDARLRDLYGVSGCVYLLALVNAPERYLTEATFSGGARVSGSPLLARNPFFAIDTDPAPGECKAEASVGSVPR